MNAHVLLPQLPLVCVGFEAISKGVFRGCVGCIDGLCVRIQRPPNGGKNGVPNPAKYYNRKGFHALQMQGVCDAKRRIRYASLICAGSVHDSAAYTMSSLGRLFLEDKKLPSEYFLNGDDAYACNNQVLQTLIFLCFSCAFVFPLCSPACRWSLRIRAGTFLKTKTASIIGKAKCESTLSVHLAFSTRGGESYGGVYE